MINILFRRTLTLDAMRFKVIPGIANLPTNNTSIVY